jgi:predicted GNAT family N-acyltransferase
LDKRQSKHEFTIEPLAAMHKRGDFSCGVPELDAYLQKQAGQDLRRHAAVPFIATPDGTKIAGYYTLSQFAIELDVVPDEFRKKLPQYPSVPATLLGRLAVSTEFRGQRLGEFLLMDACYRTYEGSKQLASTALIVDAIDDAALSFYAKYGFMALPKVPKRLFLPMGTIEKLFR